MSDRSIKKLCKLADQMNALSVAAKHMSSGDQVESGLSDEGARLYEEILKECAALARPEAMTTNQTIDGVPRALLERLSGLFTGGKHRIGVEALHELRALLDAKPVMCHGCMGDGVSHDHFDSAGKCKAAQPQDEPVAALEKARDVLRAIIKDKAAGVHYASAQAACHQINHALEQPAPVAAARMCDCNQGRLACSCRP